MAKSRKDKIEATDIALLYDLAWNQFREDRSIVLEQYKDLRAFIAADNTRYAFSGDTLSKMSDQLVKQTAQVLELIKLAHDSTEEDGSLSKEEIAEITEEIESSKSPATEEKK